MTKTVQANSKHESLSRIVERYKKDVFDRIPYKVNLVRILGANENAHTEILSEILRYKRGEAYPFLQSFLEMALQTKEVDKLKVSKPSVDLQCDYIDALVWEDGKYAVIIENKINGAQDQQKQIERYLLEAQKKCRVPAEKEYLVYLTSDGRKKAADFSLTNIAQKILGYSGDNHGRYIEMNYKDHVLPWLKEEVIVDCRYSEQTLLSMLQQYIDYLEDRFSFIDERRKDAVGAFFRKVLGSYSSNQHAQYDKLNEWLDEYENFPEEKKSDDTAEELTQFIQDAWVFQYQMLEENYSLDYKSAVDAEIETIRNWAAENGFIKPSKYSDKEGVCASFKFEHHKCIVVFEVAFYYSNNKLSVCLYNSDYEAKKIQIHEFKGLYEKFKECFQGAPEENEKSITRYLGTLNSKQELILFLNKSVTPFLSADDRCKQK